MRKNFVSKKKNPSDYFPEFSSLSSENYDEKLLTIKYSTAQKIIKELLSFTGENSVFVLIGKDVGTWMAAFARNPKVAQVYVEMTSETSSYLERNRKTFSLTSKTNLFKSESYEKVLSKSQPNWNLFYLSFDSFLTHRVEDQVSKVFTFFYNSFPEFTRKGWVFESKMIPFSNIGILYGEFRKKEKNQKIKTNPETAWLVSLQRFLYDKLIPYFQNEEDLLQILQQGPMNNIWVRVFTSRTFNRVKNSETLEFIGDTRLADVFSNVLHEKDPLLNEAQMSSLTQYYMSEQFQPELSRKMGMDKFLRLKLPEKSSDRIQEHFFRKAHEDLFEAFIGGITQICTDFFGPAFSYQVCLEIMRDLFKDIEIDMSKSKGSEKTLFLEFFTKKGLARPTFNTLYEDDGIIKTQILVDQNTINTFLSKYGITITSKFAEGEGRLKKESEKNAIENAFAFIEKKKIQEKKEDFFSLPSIEEFVEDLQILFEEGGFSNPRFEVSPDGKISYVSLIVEKDGEEKILSIGEGTRIDDAQRDAVEKYVSN